MLALNENDVKERYERKEEGQIRARGVASFAKGSWTLDLWATSLR